MRRECCTDRVLYPLFTLVSTKKGRPWPPRLFLGSPLVVLHGCTSLENTITESGNFCFPTTAPLGQRHNSPDKLRVVRGSWASVFIVATNPRGKTAPQENGVPWLLLGFAMDLLCGTVASKLSWWLHVT